MSLSEDLQKRRFAAVARAVGSVIPSYVDRAGGGTLTDVDGREWIDFAAGIAVTSVGNSAPRVVAAVKEQVERFTHTSFMVAPYESYVAVCEELNSVTPGSFDKRSALFNSGAEAVENAVKIARHATGRPAVVVFDHAYHGRTNLTMALTAKNMRCAGGRRRPARSSSPTRSRPASAGPGTGSPVTTRGSSRTWSRSPRGSPADCRWRR
jgi:4-aminobutyrate aminotransferase/(S)-3-amino-2-methylpropionate transaminase